MKGDFTATAVIDRADNDRIEGTGIVIYANEDGSDRYGVYVRSDVTADRVDFYMDKHENGNWLGFLIAEEYQATGKDCFVSVDEGWDATSDESFTLSVKVEGKYATVRMTGNNSGKYGELTFDLTEGASQEAGAANSWNEGYVVTASNIGTAKDLVVITDAPTVTTTTTSAPAADGPVTGDNTLQTVLIVAILATAAALFFSCVNLKKTAA